MSTTLAKTLQRGALAALALVTAAGSAVEAQAARVDSYVPADRAATAPGTLAATRAGTVRIVETSGNVQNSTPITAPVNAANRKSGN